MRAFLLDAALAGALSVACSAPPVKNSRPVLGAHVPADGGDLILPPQPVFRLPDGGFPVDLGAPCDPSRVVESTGASLLVQDPETLARFPLKRVLQQIISTAGAATPPNELLQRLFDTENTTAGGVFADNVHCDDATNGAFQKAPAVSCPRVEGGLARSAGLLVPGDPDYFVPIAVVNRFDLTPTTLGTCGEYRIVYAKWSGRSDPQNRVFLIFEGALPNPKNTLAGCRPVTELWAGLQASAPSSRADELDKLFFQGLAGFSPVIDVHHYGLNQSRCSYSGTCGQVRLGQGMEAPWEFRQFRPETPSVGAASTTLQFGPTPDTNSPRPELFDPALADPIGEAFRTFFVDELGTLAFSSAAQIRLRSFPDYDAGESSLEGPAQPDYLARVQKSAASGPFTDLIAKSIGDLNLPFCPPGDPMTTDAILSRATGTTCAGCHAPERLISPARKIGCGNVWPKSLGQTHIDEQGNLSEALTQVFLPRRADVLGTYLRACDAGAIQDNLQRVPQEVIIECFAAGTPVTMADGTLKAIERILPGEAVLTFDQETRELLPGLVERTVVRPEADRLIVINGRLVATANHPFYTARGWIRAEDLVIGERLSEARDIDPTSGVKLAVEPAFVRELVMRPGSVTTYNLEVGVHHDYFAGGFLVHDRP